VPQRLESFAGEGSPLFDVVVLPNSNNSTYALRDLSADGDRVFFESTEGLVPDVANEQAPAPEDTNGLTNVYEWERGGSGSCTSATSCLYLLSGGTSTDLSFFLDASESGNDVFIGTRAQLVPQDRGETFEVYDARADAPQQLTPPACSGSGCQGVPSAPPIFATPSSVTFNGIGNFSPPPVIEPKRKSKPAKCRKGFVTRKDKCVKETKKAVGKRAGNERRSK
jgi:hypothetical protein